LDNCVVEVRQVESVFCDSRQTQVARAVQIQILTALCEVPKKRLIRRCCCGGHSPGTHLVVRGIQHRVDALIVPLPSRPLVLPNRRSTESKSATSRTLLAA